MEKIAFSNIEADVVDLDGLDIGYWRIKISEDLKFAYEYMYSETIDYTDKEIEFLKSIRNISSYSQSLDDKVGRLVCRKLEDSKFIKKTDLLENIWGFNSKVKTRTLETHIYRLRKKINKNFGIKRFISVKNNSYKLI